MATARYVIHQMIQDLLAAPDRAKLFALDPEAEFAAYGLTEAEKAGLRDGSINALHALGVHPNLQMKLMRLTNANAIGANASPFDAYKDRIMVR